jgi:hypothetical protein
VGGNRTRLSATVLLFVGCQTKLGLPYTILLYIFDAWVPERHMIASSSTPSYSTVDHICSQLKWSDLLTRFKQWLRGMHDVSLMANSPRVHMAFVETVRVAAKLFFRPPPSTLSGRTSHNRKCYFLLHGFFFICLNLWGVLFVETNF